MNRFFNKRNLLLFSIPGLTVNEIDLEKYKKARGLYIEDPWERVKSIFRKDDYGNRHPEYDNALNMAEIGFFFGMCYGGVRRLKVKTDEYFYTNDAKAYQSNIHAMKVLSNFQMLNFLRGGIKWGVCFAFFTGSFALVSSCCEIYRNKPAIIDSVVAGAVTGSLCKFMLGIKGMISGGLVGSVLGAIYGVTAWGLTRVTNTDEIELKYASFAYSSYREQYKEHLRTERNKVNEKVLKGSSHSLHDEGPPQPVNTEKVEAEKNEVKSNEVKNVEKK